MNTVEQEIYWKDICDQYNLKYLGKIKNDKGSFFFKIEFPKGTFFVKLGKKTHHIDAYTLNWHSTVELSIDNYSIFDLRDNKKTYPSNFNLEHSLYISLFHFDNVIFDLKIQNEKESINFNVRTSDKKIMAMAFDVINNRCEAGLLADYIKEKYLNL